MDDLSFSVYLGVDVSEEAIRKATADGHARSTFVVGEVARLDVGKFDIAVLNEVLYYAPDAKTMLASVAEVIEPGGHLLVSMWRHPGDRVLWRTVSAVFELVDRVDVRNRANQVNKRGWTVACFQLK
jgi:2-polyprenyl-3-methyl-5-hydroxy-6-metoxy-1,4-benzoquinol methylase